MKKKAVAEGKVTTTRKTKIYFYKDIKINDDAWIKQEKLNDLIEIAKIEKVYLNRTCRDLYDACHQLRSALIQYVGVDEVRAWMMAICSEECNPAWPEPVILKWIELFGSNNPDKPRGRPAANDKRISIGGKVYIPLKKDGYKFITNISNTDKPHIPYEIKASVLQQMNRQMVTPVFSNSKVGRELADCNRVAPAFSFSPKLFLDYGDMEVLTGVKLTVRNKSKKGSGEEKEEVYKDSTLLKIRYSKKDNPADVKYTDHYIYFSLPSSDTVKKNPYMMDILYALTKSKGEAYSYKDGIKIEFDKENNYKTTLIIPITTQIKQVVYDPNIVVGIDVGVKNIATAITYSLTDSKSFSKKPKIFGDEFGLRNMYLKRKALRRREQAAALSNKGISTIWWSNASLNAIRNICKKIINYTKGFKAGTINIEDLNKFPGDLTYSLPTGKFREELTNMAKKEGIAVVAIPANNTSKICHECGWLDKMSKKGHNQHPEYVFGRYTRDWFKCGNPKCTCYNVDQDADVNAAFNIAKYIAVSKEKD